MRLQPHGVGERVEREGVLGRALDAEEVDLRAQPEDEVVVSQRLELGELDLARLEVDAVTTSWWMRVFS